MLILELQEFQRLFAQMDILHQHLIKFWSRDTRICQRVLGNLTPTPPGVEFWRIRLELTVQDIGKRANNKRSRLAGSSFLWCKSGDSEQDEDSSLTV